MVSLPTPPQAMGRGRLGFGEEAFEDTAQILSAWGHPLWGPRPSGPLPGT